jgi:archaellum component FlaG (FlaF/FlaG flagellin family)
MKFKTSLLAIACLVGAVGISLPIQANSLQNSSFEIAQSRQPQKTYMTPQRDPNQIAIQINDGEFVFAGMLKRTSGNMYIAQDKQVRVMYDKGTSRVVVINIMTGDEFYNYIFSTANEGSL